MKLLCLNAELGVHSEAIEMLLTEEQPDIACFQEIKPDMVERWKNDFFKEGVYAPMVSEQSQPFGGWGVAIMSNMQLGCIDNQDYDAFKEDYPEFKLSRSERPRATLLSVKLPDTNSLTIATTHFTWSPGGKVTDQQQVNFERLLKCLKGKNPLLLCGDFNAPRHREIYTRLSQEFRDEIPASWESTIDPQFHRAGPLPYVVDGLFTRGPVTISGCRKVCGVSDHCAIIANLHQI